MSDAFLAALEMRNKRLRELKPVLADCDFNYANMQSVSISAYDTILELWGKSLGFEMTTPSPWTEIVAVAPLKAPSHGD